jgi:hypothetical protein
MSDQYRICWRSKVTGEQWQGAYIYTDKSIAEQDARDLDLRLPADEHWVEPVLMEAPEQHA